MPAHTAALADEGQLTLDMVHQYAYCPRRYHLMYIEGRWADNAYTVEGRQVHRRVDRLDHVLPQAGTEELSDEGTDQAVDPTNSGSDDDPPTISRSVPLHSDTLGVTAKLDTTF